MTLHEFAISLMLVAYYDLRTPTLDYLISSKVHADNYPPHVCLAFVDVMYVLKDIDI